MKIKGISMMDLIREIERGKATDGYIKEALARGGRTIIVDENVKSISQFLKNKNYSVDTVPGGIDDETLKRDLLDGKIFITNNEQHFTDREDRLYYHYGLISVPNMNGKTLAGYIEKCLMSANFGNDVLQVWKIYNDGSFEKID